MLRERRRGLEMDAVRDRAVAWMTAGLTRAKRLPPFEKFVEAPQQPALTADEIQSHDKMIDELAASAGLAVLRDPKPESDGYQ